MPFFSHLGFYAGYIASRLFMPERFKPVWSFFRALPFFAAGLRSLLRRSPGGGWAGRLDVPVLDASAVGAALAQKNYNQASTLMMLLKTGEYLEEWAKERSRTNLAASLLLNPGNVRVRGDDGEEREIPYEKLKPGAKIILRPGAFVPVDGRVVSGRAFINEARLTGEPLAAEKSAGGAVHAGTVVEEGEVLAEVLKKGEDTRYQQIIKLIENSEGAKADTEIRALRMADKAVPFSFALAGLTWAISRDARKAASVLSVDYSCAVKLSTPLAFLQAVREGLAHGVFFKGGAPVEKLAGVDTVIFDKTGTLTCAAPCLERVIPYNGTGEREALKIAACLEEHFPHPMARAVVTAACRRKLKHKEEHTQVKYIAAHGIATEYRGRHTVIGSRHFICEDEGVNLDAAQPDEEAAAAGGYSILYLAQEGKLLALLLISDPLREEAREVVMMLRALGIKRIYMLSGDNRRNVEKISRELALDGAIGELLPAGKMAIVSNLKKAGCKTAFVGDGMNDSPAMSQADVGIAMKDGADIARETADITLTEGSLYPLVIARLLSGRVLRRVHTNTRAAIGLNSLFILSGLLNNKNGTANSGARAVWLHNITTLLLSLNALSPLLKE